MRFFLFKRNVRGCALEWLEPKNQGNCGVLTTRRSPLPEAVEFVCASIHMLEYQRLAFVEDNPIELRRFDFLVHKRPKDQQRGTQSLFAKPYLQL